MTSRRTDRSRSRAPSTTVGGTKKTWKHLRELFRGAGSEDPVSARSTPRRLVPDFLRFTRHFFQLVVWPRPCLAKSWNRCVSHLAFWRGFGPRLLESHLALHCRPGHVIRRDQVVGSASVMTCACSKATRLGGLHQTRLVGALREDQRYLSSFRWIFEFSWQSVSWNTIDRFIVLFTSHIFKCDMDIKGL